MMWPLLACAVLTGAVILERLVSLSAGETGADPNPFRFLGILDTIITVAPLLGLLGTVTGMIRAFHVMDRTGLAEPGRITGGVAEALIATAAGLAIAIVALIGYNAVGARAQQVAAAQALPAVGDASHPRRWPRPVLRKARIEIIPMIDTIFFLLVFFMVTSLTEVRMRGLALTCRGPAPAPGPATRALVVACRRLEHSR